MSFVAEQFREEAETLIKDVIFNDNYWTEVTSTLPEKVTKGSDIKVYENSSSSSNVVLKFVRTMNGTVKDLQRVLQSKDAQKQWDKQSANNIDIVNNSTEFANIKLTYTKSRAQGPFSSRHTVFGTHLYEREDGKSVSFSKSLNDLDCLYMKENNVVMTINFGIFINEQIDDNTIKVTLGRSLNLDLGYFIPIGRIRSRLAVITPYSMHMMSKLMKVEDLGSNDSNNSTSNPQGSASTALQTNKNGSVVRNEDLQRLKDMIKKLRSKLKWLEKLGFISLSSIVLILIYNLFVGRRR